jgi:Fic family protein
MPRPNPIITNLPQLPLKSPCSTDALMPWLVKSRAELGELKGFTAVFRTNPGLISPIFLIEATDSLWLDGINTSRETILENQLLNDSEQSFDNRQVFHHRNALINGREILTAKKNGEFNFNELLPLFSEKKTGNLRTESISLPRISAPFQLNQFPDHKQVKELNNELEHFIKDEDPSYDALVRCIVASARFDSIRPLPESGSRSSRVLFQLLLVRSGLLAEPILLLSPHLRKNIDVCVRLYQEAVSQGDWCPYVKFMLHGISIQAKETKDRLEKLLGLYYNTMGQVKEKCAQIFMPELVDSIFHLPVISPLRLSSKLNIHYTTATRYLKKLEEEGFLENKQSGKYQLYSNKALIELLNRS